MIVHLEASAKRRNECSRSQGGIDNAAGHRDNPSSSCVSSSSDTGKPSANSHTLAEEVCHWNGHPKAELPTGKGEAAEMVPPYECNVCQRCFSLEQSLLNHARTHTRERPYACRFCPKFYISSKNLHAHGRKTLCLHHLPETFHHEILPGQPQRRSHASQRPFTCTFCQKCFSEKRCLFSHESLHTGDRPYECPACQNASPVTTTSLNTSYSTQAQGMSARSVRSPSFGTNVSRNMRGCTRSGMPVTCARNALC